MMRMMLGGTREVLRVNSSNGKHRRTLMERKVAWLRATHHDIGDTDGQTPREKMSQRGTNQ
ncbi:MAG TPA: hypothetical protein DHW45_13235 [Candidatus Latescibacteria bacterium]|nr:hypothetical protein [Candidatus Latescibacterota bacterium]